MSKSKTAKIFTFKNSPPKGSVVVKRVHGNNWAFEFPRLREEVYDLFHEALDEIESGNAVKAEKDIRVLIDGYPEFIDAFHHLALLLSDSDKEREAFSLWKNSVNIGLQALPKSFKIGRHRLPWGILENRPFLRAYHSWGLLHFDRGDIHTALSIFKNILSMNPADNQGIRGLLVDSYFSLRQPEEVLNICKHFPGDTMEELLYGKPLDLFQLGFRNKADSSLAEAIQTLPLIANELLKTRHPTPKDMKAGSLTHGGEDQAYHYWLHQGQYWKSTPGAIDFINAVLFSANRRKVLS